MEWLGMYEYNAGNVNTKYMISVSAILLQNNITFPRKCTVD